MKLIVNGFFYMPIKLIECFFISINMFKKNSNMYIQKQNLYVSLLFQKETEAKKRTQIPAAVRKKLWSQEIGLDNMTGLCNLCESQITYTNYHAGHIISSCNGGTDNISNLKILCPLCNLSMSSTNLEEFRERYF